MALAVAVGACESVTSKQTWRSPTLIDADYFSQLAWGYSLSDVERIVIGETAADDGAGSDDTAGPAVED